MSIYRFGLMRIPTALIILALVSYSSYNASCQLNFGDIKQMDSLLFDVGFNQCDTSLMSSLLAHDFEFLHDTGGPQNKARFMRSFKDAICPESGPKPIRISKAASFEFYPMHDQGKLYGVIQKGEHDFFLRDPDGEMTHTNEAQFTHFWKLVDSEWQLWRAWSFDHSVPRNEMTSEILKAVEKGAQYLQKCLREDGSFEYRVNMDPEISVRKKYNMLRHAGTIFAMCDAYQLSADAKLKTDILRAATYMKEQTIKTIPGQSNMSAVWSDPDRSGTGDPLQAKLGGAGLGLVALLSVEQIEPGFTSLEELRALGEFIIFMQKEDGSFYSKFIPEKDGQDDSWQSLFYPGEAAFGLAMLYETDPQPKWLAAANRTLEFLELSRRGKDDVPVDHWSLIASSKLIELARVQDAEVSEELILNHALQNVKVIMGSQVSQHRNHRFHGGFNDDGRTTPTATRLEGLLAAHTFLSHLEVADDIKISIDAGIRFLLDAQIKSGLYEGGMPRAVERIEGEDYEFNERATEIRIDYVQHAMSAWAAYLKLAD